MPRRSIGLRADDRGGAVGKKATCAIRWPPAADRPARECGPAQGGRPDPVRDLDAGASPAARRHRPAGGSTAATCFRPTVFADATPETRIVREEIFGPVLSVMPFRDEDEAIAIANDTPYGLASYVQTGSPERARRVANRIRAGMVQVNGAAHSPDTPFGGEAVGQWAGVRRVRDDGIPRAQVHQRHVGGRHLRAVRAVPRVRRRQRRTANVMAAQPGGGGYVWTQQNIASAPPRRSLAL